MVKDVDEITRGVEPDEYVRRMQQGGIHPEFREAGWVV
jgi:hypothetical protein